jgi:hypothetical protein
LLSFILSPGKELERKGGLKVKAAARQSATVLHERAEGEKKRWRYWLALV